ncbi:hypothetical protein [Sporosarcina sp. G11-34]|uniref:hypothetical protein n=1 Tax=Sporosarcina sp. G11-34 TaxID=2849605 RepID=UPI0022A8F395|nr:hypothetical protein [Sporosarcina sp. G11-34]MCZ2259884.1 hypothetical protein [Sporosarcina sp. G11-34]
MNLKRKVNNNVMEYILNKLSALGLLVLTMSIYLILVNGFDMYGFTESLSNLKAWGLICGYALVTTVLIDLVRVKWIPFTFKVSVLLHCLAGFIVFLPLMGFNFFALIAGSIGALCALIYAFSSYFLAGKKQFVWIFLLVFPLLLSVRLIDFTIKEDWNEERTTSSFFAEFERFNGKNEIPIPLKKGNVVTSYLSFDQMNGGGYGYHILDNNGEYVVMKELEEADGANGYLDTTAIQFQAVKEGIYFIIVTGDELKGKIDVTWEIE